MKGWGQGLGFLCSLKLQCLNNFVADNVAYFLWLSFLMPIGFSLQRNNN